MNPFKSNSINDDDDYDDNVTCGGGERPLDEKLPYGFEFEDNDGDTHMWTGAIELHRLVAEDIDQLEKRKDEITSTIIDLTFDSYSTYDDDDDGIDNGKRVSQPPLPLLPSSRHCTLLVGWEDLKQRSCS